MFDNDDFIIRDGRADRPLGYPPSSIFKKHLENLYISIVGALDIGDFETFLKESADLTYDEARDKLIREYGTPQDLSEARLKAKSKEAAFELELAEKEALAEQRTLEQEFSELDEIARKRLAENFELSRRNEALEAEVKRLKEELAKKPTLPVIPPAITHPPLIPSLAHGSMYDEFSKLINQTFTLSDLDEIASEIYDIAEHKEYDKLTEKDIRELTESISTTYKKRSMKLAEAKLPEIKTKIIKAERPSEKIPPEEISGAEVEFRPVMFEIKTLNSMNAKRFFGMYKNHIKDILFSGIENWLNAHPEAYKFPLTSYNVKVLADNLIYIIKIPSQNIRNIVAYEFLRDYIELILLFGIDASFEQYSDELNTKYNYYNNILKLKEMPGLEAFRKDVYNSIISII